MAGVFERFTEPARQVVSYAQEEARGLKHEHIGTEHILLGLVREKEGVAAQAIESLGLDLEGISAQIVGIIGSGEEVTPRELPFTPRAKKVLELALREARALKHNYIGTEHVLLGLVRENGGLAPRILSDFAATPQIVAAKTIELLGGDPAGEYVDGFDAVFAQQGSHHSALPHRSARTLRSQQPLLLGWLLFGVALGLGVLIGWAIWG